jgi:hypothetical protein
MAYQRGFTAVKVVPAGRSMDLIDFIKQDLARKKANKSTGSGTMKIGLCHKCSEVITKSVAEGVKEVIGCKQQPNVKGCGMHTCPLMPTSEHNPVSGESQVFVISK